MRGDPSPGEPAALAVRGLTKRFGATVALDAVDLTVRVGEVHALLGANGAGKSTLIKILAGVHRADAGTVQLGGLPLEQVGQRRISFVHQDLALITGMSVGENMAMGFGYPRRAGLIDWKEVQVRAAQAFDRLGCALPLDRTIAELSQAERSIVAIARALSDDVDLLVLDEPTASLPEADVERLFGVVDRLRRQNISILYVTHRLDEVFRIGDAATVFRDGRTVAMHRPVAVSSDELVTDIVGRRTARHTASAPPHTSAPVLEVLGLRAAAAGPVSFTVGRGEIVGLAGLRGQGHEEIGRALAGILPVTAGIVALDGKPLRLQAPGDAIARRIGFATGRRAEEGMAATLTVRENLFLNPLNFGRGIFGLRGPRRETTEAARILTRFDVRPADPNKNIADLSGGNQQKVVLARWAGQGYRVLVLEDPTIGVDFGAKAEIYRMLAADAAAGTAIVIVSSDLDELVQLCHHALVFNHGRVSAVLAGPSLGMEALTREVGGGSAEVLTQEAVVA